MGAAVTLNLDEIFMSSHISLLYYLSMKNVLILTGKDVWMANIFKPRFILLRKKDLCGNLTVIELLIDVRIPMIPFEIHP